MVLLGNVRSVSSLAAEVELPGRIYGFLNVGAVSDVLTDRIKTQVKDEHNEKQVIFDISFKGTANKLFFDCRT